MARVRFEKGARVVWDELVYVIEERLEGDKFILKNVSLGGLRMATRQELLIAWAGDKLLFETFGHSAVKRPERQLATAYTVADFDSLPEKSRYVAWRRYQYVLPFAGLPPSQRSRKAIAAYLIQNASIIEARARAYREGFKGPMPELPPVPEDIDHDSASEAGKKQRRKGKGTYKATLGEAASPASVERWISEFMLSGYSIRGLAPKTSIGRAEYKSRFGEQIEEIMDKVLDEYRGKDPQRRLHNGVSSGHNTIHDVHLTVVSRIGEWNKHHRPADTPELKVPTYDTVRARIYESGRAVQILKRPAADRLEAHKGAIIRPGVKVTRIMQRIELDDTWLDLIVVDEVRHLPLGRPNLTFGVDAYCGLAGGKYIGYEKSSSNAARQCTLDLVLPKPNYPSLYGTKRTCDIYGLPELLVTDGGPGYNSEDMYTSCAEAGIVFEILPVQMAWLKGHVERFFRTTDVALLKRQPGSTFSNILERGGYDAEKWACISLKGFLEVIHIFLVDYLPAQWHEGLECYPGDRWAAQASIYEPVLNHSADDLRRIFSRTEERMIHDYGIEFETIRYNSAALHALGSCLPGRTRVRFKVDDYDLSQIHVLDDTNPAAQVWLPVPAVDQDYTRDLSLWSHRIIRRFVNSEKAAGEQASLREMAEAKERIQKIVLREFLTSRSTRNRQTAQRYLDETGFGQQPGGLLVTSSSVSHERVAAQKEKGTGTGSSEPLALPAPAPKALPVPEAAAGEAVGEGVEITTEVEILQFPAPIQPEPVAVKRPTGDYGLPGMQGQTGGPRPRSNGK